MFKTPIASGLTLAFALAATTVSAPSHACGGFFCTTVPINQAAEQIVFRQEAGTVTAMVRILYSGDAEDFSWVIPVPDTPELSIGSDTTFNDLDFATQPRFELRTEGQTCPQDDQIFALAESDSAAEGGAADGGVVIEEQLELGPFNIDIVSSDNPDDMNIWLADNGYLVTDRGNELIAPYVNAGMKFVAVKLRSGESSGNIQPIIMKYASEKPMVPIRLTAVAAQDDMGVLVWVVNDQLGRAIPENYAHVIPNYTRLDWFSGFGNTYGSYQNLITEAMNESGGQGFATDFAGTIDSSLANSLTSPARIEANLALLDGVADDAEFIQSALFNSTTPGATLATLQSILPLPEGLTQDVYFDPNLMRAIFTSDELRDARNGLRAAIVERELEPLQNSVALMPEGAYMTRLYTTLSADEMTLDPTFNYNRDMPDQSITREATVSASCINDVSNWRLTLGPGTGRDGEVVMEVNGQPIPFFGGNLPQPVDDQPATFQSQRTSADAEPETQFQANLTPLVIQADGSFEGGVMESTVVEMGPDVNGESGSDTGIDGLIADSGSSSSSFFGAAGPAVLAILSLFGLRRRRNR